jgi:hypothetical protein
VIGCALHRRGQWGPDRILRNQIESIKQIPELVVVVGQAVARLGSRTMELDLEVLDTFSRRPGLRSVAQVAESIGCSEEEARARLSDLESQGYLWGPIYGWDLDMADWTEYGYGLRNRGRDVLAGGPTLP